MSKFGHPGVTPAVGIRQCITGLVVRHNIIELPGGRSQPTLSGVVQQLLLAGQVHDNLSILGMLLAGNKGCSCVELASSPSVHAITGFLKQTPF